MDKELFLMYVNPT